MRTVAVTLSQTHRSDISLFAKAFHRPGSDDHLVCFKTDGDTIGEYITSEEDHGKFRMGYQIFDRQAQPIGLPEAVGPSNIAWCFAFREGRLYRQRLQETLRGLRHAERFVLMAGPDRSLRAKAYYQARWLKRLYPHAEFAVSNISWRTWQESATEVLSPISSLDLETASIAVSTHAETEFWRRFMPSRACVDHFPDTVRHRPGELLYADIQCLLEIGLGGAGVRDRIDALVKHSPYDIPPSSRSLIAVSPEAAFAQEQSSFDRFHQATSGFAIQIESSYALNSNCRAFLQTLGPGFHDPDYAETRARWIADGFSASRQAIEDYFERVFARL